MGIAGKIVERDACYVLGAHTVTRQEIAAINAIALHGTIERAALALGLSRHTVDAHLDRLRNATGLRCLPQLVAWAAANGYLTASAEEMAGQRQKRPEN